MDTLCYSTVQVLADPKLPPQRDMIDSVFLTVRVRQNHSRRTASRMPMYPMSWIGSSQARPIPRYNTRSSQPEKRLAIPPSPSSVIRIMVRRTLSPGLEINVLVSDSDESPSSPLPSSSISIDSDGS